MRKATEAVLQTRTYSNLSWETVLNLTSAMANNGGGRHPIFQQKKDVKNVGIIFISSNRGFCGGFNSAIISKIHKSILKHEKNASGEKINHEIILIGKKGSAIYKYYGYNIVAEFPKSDLADEVSEVVPIAKLVLSGFMSGKYDKILVAYTDFINPAKQVARVKQLLPISIDAADDHFRIGILGEDTRVGTDKKLIEEKHKKHTTQEKMTYDYIFEPSAREVLGEMVPRLLEVQLFQALLESNASVHSARMAAMKQATDAAEELVDELTLSYNKARQAGITAELAEISAGANAIGR